MTKSTTVAERAAGRKFQRGEITQDELSAAAVAARLAEESAEESAEGSVAWAARTAAWLADAPAVRAAALMVVLRPRRSE